MTQQSHDPYAAIAHLYALEFAHEEQDDIQLFLNLARMTGGPILEAGTGTGRVAHALARKGYEVTGLDSSAAMLAQARKRRASRSAGSLRWLQADLLSLDLQERFSLAIAPDNTFAHFHTQDAQQKALATLERHLAPGATLAIVLQNPYSLVIDPPQDEVVWIWERPGPEKGQTATKFAAMEVELAEQLLQVRLWYDVLSLDGFVRRSSTQLTYRWFYPPELEMLLERAGYEVEGYYGSYDLQPYHADSPLLIALGKKIREARDVSQHMVF